MKSTSGVSDPARPADPATLEQIAIGAAVEAAALIRSAVGSALPLRAKSSPTDVVTQTDVDAEALIRTILTAATPGASLLGEEAGETRTASSLQWVIDPLDGTVNFLYTIPIVSVSIAAYHDGVPVAGAVVDVNRGECFSAAAGRGARLDGHPIAVSGCAQLSQALVATGFSYAAALREGQGRIVHTLLPLARDIRCFGSAALNHCWVAMGRLDAYYERDTKLWDYAAGAFVAREAGARIELPCPENDRLAMSATPEIFEDLRRAVELPAEHC
jgi:myo-inositol-1(or 4)-monophosphatase